MSSPTNQQRYSHIINRFSEYKILVIGDSILDIYVRGISTRLAPEAPVPVVDVIDEQICLGGAANTACNISALGAATLFCTVIGADEEGHSAIKLLKNAGIDSDLIVRSQDRQTITKTRIIAGTQTVTRIDKGSDQSINETDYNELTEKIKSVWNTVEAVIISDYSKGIFTEKIIDDMKLFQKQHPIFIALDSKRANHFNKLHVSLFKPNYEELTQLLPIPRLNGKYRVDQVISIREKIQEAFHADTVSVTLDADGSVLLNNDNVVFREAPVVSTPQVSGAGDTYLSVLTLALLASNDFNISADIATAAAHLMVSKECTSVCQHTELLSYFHQQEKIVFSLNDLHILCRHYHIQQKRIVFTNGCFDILHSGHVTYLHCAKKLGDVLIVGINTDESIHRLKGNGRPINTLNDRLRVIAGLASVDHVIAFGSELDDTPIQLIEIVKPHTFVKGGDYTEKDLPEAEAIKRNGGEIQFMPHIPDQSTSSIIKKISQQRSILI